MSLLDKLRKPFVIGAVGLGVILGSLSCTASRPSVQQETQKDEELTASITYRFIAPTVLVTETTENGVKDYYTGITCSEDYEPSISKDKSGNLIVNHKKPGEAIQSIEIDLERISLDSDTDGLTDIEEERFFTEMYNPDTDGDGVIDSQDNNPRAAPRNDDLSEVIRVTFNDFYKQSADFNYFPPPTIIYCDTARIKYDIDFPVIVIHLNENELEKYKEKFGDGTLTGDLPFYKQTSFVSEDKSEINWTFNKISGFKISCSYTLEKKDGKWNIIGDSRCEEESIAIRKI